MIKRNYDMFLENIIKKNAKKRTFITQFFETVPESDLKYYVLMFHNVLLETKNPDISFNIRKELNHIIENVKSESIKTYLELIIEINSINEKIKKGEQINSSELFEKWTNNKDFDSYPIILGILIDNGYYNDEIKQECLSVLNHDPTEDKADSYFSLAYTFAEKLIFTDVDVSNKMIPITYLKNSINIWKRHIPTKKILKIYLILGQLDYENRDNYKIENLKWQKIKAEQDHLESFPELAKQGEYFLIFWDYFDYMKYWGLQTELSHNDFFNHINVNQEQKRNLAHEWKKNGSIIPEPFIEQIDKTAVSSEFLYLGHYIFNPPNNTDSNFDQERNLYNKASHVALSRLLKLVIELPDLPASLKELFISYSQTDIYTLPED